MSSEPRRVSLVWRRCPRNGAGGHVVAGLMICRGASVLEMAAVFPGTVFYSGWHQPCRRVRPGLSPDRSEGGAVRRAVSRTARAAGPAWPLPGLRRVGRLSCFCFPACREPSEFSRARELASLRGGEGFVRVMNSPLSWHHWAPVHLLSQLCQSGAADPGLFTVCEMLVALAAQNLMFLSLDIMLFLLYFIPPLKKKKATFLHSACKSCF